MARKTKRATVTLKKSKTKAQKERRKEVSLIGQALRSLGGLGGGAIGGMFGQAGVGNSVGTSLGAAISKWLGAGDYTVKQNSIVQATLKGSNSIPMMHNMGQSVTIRHKEFLCSVKGSKDFTLQRFFLLQPGDTNTFPWLSGVANRFQQYRIKGMVFHYVPTSGYAVSGDDPSLGAVMIQTSYRANDSDPTSKVEMMNEYWASENVPSDSFCHPIECSPQENPFQIHYVRTLPVPSGDSPLLYDIGKTYVATQGMPGEGKVVGDLWVTYEIELLKPQIRSDVLSETGSAVAESVGTVTSGSAPLGNALSVATGTIPFSMINRTITFPVGLLGRFIVTIRLLPVTTFTAVDLSGAPVLTNCEAWPIDSGLQTYTRTVMVAGAGATVNSGYYQFGVSLTDPSNIASALISGGSWTGTASFTRVTVAQL